MIPTIDVWHKIICKKSNPKKKKNYWDFLRLLKIENHWVTITNATKQDVFCILMLQPWFLEIKFENFEPHFEKKWIFNKKKCQALVISYGIEENYFMQKNLVKHFHSF
jgi:hypothetical protein